MPSTALLCDLLVQRGEDSPSLQQRLYVLPDRVVCEDRSPVAMACALVASVFCLDPMRGAWGDHGSGISYMDTTLLPPGMVFPIGSWGWTVPRARHDDAHGRPMPTLAWDAFLSEPADVVLTLIMPRTAQDGGPVIAVSHLGQEVTRFDATTFFPPRLWFATRDDRRVQDTPLDVHKIFGAWADGTALPVLLGALDSALPLPLEEPVGDLVKRPWMAAVLAGACRVLKPWRGERSYPLRGYGRRPFSAHTPLDEAQRLTLAALLGPGAVDETKDWNGTMALRGDLAHVVAHGVLEPNRAYAPTHWAGGVHWGHLLASFPPDLVEAGRRAGAVAQGAFGDLDVHSVLSLSAPAGSSRHQAMACRSGHVLVDEALSSASAWLRPRRRRITAPLIDKDDA